MGVNGWTWLFVGATFATYVGIATYTRARSTSAYYVAEKRVASVMNGMATAADWISAASFISMAGVIAFMGRDGSAYLMGWTGGYVLLAVLLAPYLRKYGKYTVPQFVGDRYYSRGARVLALLCAIFISFTYVAGQLRGVGIVFARFLDVSVGQGALFGMAIVFAYTALGGMKGVTYTQVAQYVVLTAAFLVPAIFLSLLLTGHPVPALGYGARLSETGAALLGVPAGQHLLDAVNGLGAELGFAPYTGGSRPRLDVLTTTVALMAGTAGLPHIIIRFFTVQRIRDARSSAGWALLFIVLFYTATPAVAAFSRATFLASVHDRAHAERPGWFKVWEHTGLVGWSDKNGDGRMQLSADAAGNEVEVDHDIMVLATPEIARLPPWVAALVAAGALAAALSTAAGLLLVISAAIAHDLMKGVLWPAMSERAELRWARIVAFGAVILAGHFGVNPPALVAQTVAFAFGLAASSFFPVLVMGIFWKRATREGAMAGMASGILFTGSYIAWFTLVRPDLNDARHWWLGISPEGIGAVGMLLNFAVAGAVSLVTRAPPREVQDLVSSLRYPLGAGPPPASTRRVTAAKAGPRY